MKSSYRSINDFYNRKEIARGRYCQRGQYGGSFPAILNNAYTGYWTICRGSIIISGAPHNGSGRIAIKAYDKSQITDTTMIHIRREATLTRSIWYINFWRDDFYTAAETYEYNTQRLTLFWWLQPWCNLLRWWCFWGWFLCLHCNGVMSSWWPDGAFEWKKGRQETFRGDCGHQCRYFFSVIGVFSLTVQFLTQNFNAW